MSSSNGSPPRPSEFPATEEFEDFAGRLRKFNLKLEQLAWGYVVFAAEAVEGHDDGYEFSAFSQVDGFQALGELRLKIRKLLSVRHLSRRDGECFPTHDRLRGQIGYGGVVVDGIFMPFEEFAELIQTYEGFQFDLKFVDSSDELE